MAGSGRSASGWTERHSRRAFRNPRNGDQLVRKAAILERDNVIMAAVKPLLVILWVKQDEQNDVP